MPLNDISLFLSTFILSVRTTRRSHTCVCIHVHAYVTHVCAYAHVHVHVYTHSRAYMRTCVHTYRHIVRSEYISNWLIVKHIGRYTHLYVKRQLTDWQVVSHKKSKNLTQNVKMTHPYAFFRSFSFAEPLRQIIILPNHYAYLTT